MIGHNAQRARITIEARFFNSLARYSGGDGLCRTLEVAGAAAGRTLSGAAPAVVRDR